MTKPTKFCKQDRVTKNKLILSSNMQYRLMLVCIWDIVDYDQYVLGITPDCQ